MAQPNPQEQPDIKPKQYNLKDYLTIRDKLKKSSEDHVISPVVKIIILIPIMMLVFLILGYIFYIRSVQY